MIKKLILPLLFCFFINSFSYANDVYKVGVILPLSGSAESLGNYLKNGINLAFNNLSKKEKEKIKLYFEDDQLQARLTVSAFKKLKSIHNVDAILTLGSGSGNVLNTLAEKSKTILIAIGASSQKVSKGKKYCYNHWVTPEVEAKKMTEEIIRKGYQKIGFVYAQHEGAVSVIDALRAEFKKAKLNNKLILDKSFLPDEKDYKTFIIKAKNLEVDVVAVVLFPGALSTFAKQARSLKFKGDLAGVELFEDENEVKASNGALIDQWYVNADLAEGNFVRLYQKEYEEYPGWASANAFDSVKLIAKGVNAYGNDNEKIVKFLSNVKDYSGALGVYSASGDNRFTLPATIKVVRKNGFEKLSIN